MTFVSNGCTVVVTGRGRVRIREADRDDGRTDASGSNEERERV